MNTLSPQKKLFKYITTCGMIKVHSVFTMELFTDVATTYFRCSLGQGSRGLDFTPRQEQTVSVQTHRGAIFSCLTAQECQSDRLPVVTTQSGRRIRPSLLQKPGRICPEHTVSTRYPKVIRPFSTADKGTWFSSRSTNKSPLISWDFVLNGDSSVENYSNCRRTLSGEALPEQLI